MTAEAAGQVFGSTFEAGSDDLATYKAETSMEAVKFVRVDQETNTGTKIYIESIEFSKVDPDSEVE